MGMKERVWLIFRICCSKQITLPTTTNLSLLLHPLNHDQRLRTLVASETRYTNQIPTHQPLARLSATLNSPWPAHPCRAVRLQDPAGPTPPISMITTSGKIQENVGSPFLAAIKHQIAAFIMIIHRQISRRQLVLLPLFRLLDLGVGRNPQRTRRGCYRL